MPKWRRKPRQDKLNVDVLMNLFSMQEELHPEFKIITVDMVFGSDILVHEEVTINKIYDGDTLARVEMIATQTKNAL